MCQGVQPPEPGKREHDLVREAAQYYQRALDAAHVRHEGLKRDQSSTSDEDFSFSASRDGEVVTQEPIKYPLRIKSEADLTRATSIIRDNLANIIQNYLLKPGSSPESQPLVSHLVLDHPTIKLVGTGEGEVEPQLSTNGSTESQEGSSPPPLVVAGGPTQVAPLTPFHKAPLFKSKASPQHPLLKARSSSPGPSIHMVCISSPHPKGELNNGISPCAVRKEKQPLDSSSKCTGKASARGDKRLTKSEEIVLPPFIRESHIDVPITAEDYLATTSFTPGLRHPEQCPHQHRPATTATQNKEKNKINLPLRKSLKRETKCVSATFDEPVRIGSPSGETSAADMVAKTKEISLSSTADPSMVVKIQKTVLPSDAVMAPSTDTAMVEKIRNAALFQSVQAMISVQNTGIRSSTSHTCMALEASMASTPPTDMIPDIAMIPPTPDTDTDSGPGTVITSITPDTDLTPLTPDKDISCATSAMDVAIGSPKTIRNSTTMDKDVVPSTIGIKRTPVVPVGPEVHISDLIQTSPDMFQKAPHTDLASKVQDLDLNPPLNTTMTPPVTPEPARHEECVRVKTQAGKDEAETSESVVTIVHDGCISPVMKNSLSYSSSPTNESQGEEFTQRPLCLKDIHKLNTKSSTASESSFESLPYRYLTSQPESLTEDLAMGVSIELTRPPLDTERLRAARLELIRQERIHAISLMSTVTTDSEEGQVWASSLQEQPFGSPMVENGNQESPVLDSGVELVLQETYIDNLTKAQTGSPPSPTESAPESGFSSLRETVAEGSGRGSQRGVCLSKSKDSLDLTDADRCPGTDTFSDDMETLSSSAGEATLMESGHVSQWASPRNSLSDSVSHDSTLDVSIQEASQHETEIPKELKNGSGALTEEKTSRYLSDDSSEYKMKTSESLSSEDTVVYRPSIDEQVPKGEFQGSQGDPLGTQKSKGTLSPQLCTREGEFGEGIKEARNGYGFVEDKWEPHYTWPPPASFMSQALHTSIADKLRLLSESEEEANTRVQSRGRRSKRAMSAAAGSTLGLPVSKVQPHLRVEAQTSLFQDFYTHIPKKSSTSDCKQIKQHSNKKDEELRPIIASSDFSMHSTTAKLGSSAQVSGQCTSAKTVSSACVPEQCTSVNTSISTPASDRSIKVESHSSVPVPDHSTQAKICMSDPAPVPDQHTTDNTLGSTPVSGHSIANTPSTSVKVHCSPTVSGQFVSSKNLSTASDLVQSITVKTHSNTCAPSQVITTHTQSSAPESCQSPIAMPHNGVPVPCHSTIANTDCSVSAHGQSTMTTSEASCIPPTVSKAASNGPTAGQPSIASSCSSNASTIVNTTDGCSSTTTNSSKASRNSSKSGISDLEDEVFLPPPESYILNGHPITHCSRVDMANQLWSSPSKTAMSLYNDSMVNQEGIHQNSSPLSDIHLPTQHCTPPLTPLSSDMNSVSSSITAGLSSFSSPPDAATVTSETPLPGTTAAAASVSEVPSDSQSSSTALGQQGRLPQNNEYNVDGMARDVCQVNHLPPTPQSGSPASIHLQQTPVTTTITTSSFILSTTATNTTTTAPTTPTTTTSSITEVAKSTDLKRVRPEKKSRESHNSKGEKNESRGETSPKSVGVLVDGGDGKPRLQRMANLERTDTSRSPTPTRTPTPPTNSLKTGSKCETAGKAHATSFHQRHVKRNGNCEIINKNINDIAIKLDSTEDVGQDFREEREKSKWNRGPKETRKRLRGGSEEAPARPHAPSLRKYGSEDLSRATPDSYGSSTSKSYLELDLGSVGTIQGVGGSLELLEGAKRSFSPSRTRFSMTAAQSQELSRFEQVGVKSQGSLDKFPHFDHVSASQRQVTPRRKGTSVDDPGSGKTERMHRSFTLPGSLASPRKDDKKREREEKGKKKKKEKEGTTGSGEKKSAIMSLKGLLRRNKPKEKEKEGTQEKLSSPSLFRRLERRSKSGSPSPLSDSSTRQLHTGNSPSTSPVDPSSRSPVVANGRIRPVISSPVALHQPTPMTTASTTNTTTAAPNRAGAISCSDSESAPSSTPASPQRRVPLTRGGSLVSQPSPRLYKHVLTRNMSSSQESIDSSILSSANSSVHSSPHGSPQRCVVPPSASSLSLPAVRELSPVAPVMGTRALRGSSNSFSVTIGFRPQVERRRGQRTLSEGTDLNRVVLSPGPRRGEASRVITQLGKRSSSMEILICGKIREHCPEPGSSPAGPRTPFSREGSFRLHREISVETLFEVPEGGRAGGSQEDYRRYLEHVHAARHGSCSSLAEEPTTPAPEPVAPHSVRKYSVPHGMCLSGMREAASSNPNLQRSSSPLVRGMSHSSTFSSPLRRPSSATTAFSPAKRSLCSATGGSQGGEVAGAPLMRVEEEGPLRKNLDSATDKPPNILVYAANNAEYYDKVQQTLASCLNPDRYTMYHLTDELAFKSPWSGSTTLLVVCGDVPAHISTVFIRFLLKGGRVLSVCSDFLNMAVPLFGTVEVQEQAVVSVSYQRWSSVHLLHHQHCFHSSPRNKRFSRIAEVPLQDAANRSAVSVEPTHVEIIDEYGGRHRLDLKVLATDDTWGAPTLLSAKVHGGQGTAVFSQVHLEHDPQASLPAASEASTQLAGSNVARLEILQELLASELSLDTSSHPPVTYTPAYFLGRHELKQELLGRLRPHMVEEELQRPHITIQFVMPGSVPKQPAQSLLPILTSACPLTFSTVKYFESLTTSSLGRLVIYSEVVASSMRVIAGNPPLVHGLVVLPTQQTHGQGRGGNAWLSPLGCAMFSIQLHVALSSTLGQHLCFLQHLVSMAVVQAVVTLPGYADIPLHLKWPNDIYLGSDLKIGGVVVEATTVGAQVIVNVGCGVNLSNSNPTGCLNDAIRQYNQEHNTDLAELDREVFLARVFNALEDLIHVFQTRGPGAVQHIYYKHWLHSNTVVTVQSEHRHTQSAVVVGVDSYGFLLARLASGETLTLQPDGNSFNMMEGLVYSKVQ